MSPNLPLRCRHSFYLISIYKKEKKARSQPRKLCLVLTEQYMPRIQTIIHYIIFLKLHLEVLETSNGPSGLKGTAGGVIAVCFCLSVDWMSRSDSVSRDSNSCKDEKLQTSYHHSSTYHVSTLLLPC